MHKSMTLIACIVLVLFGAPGNSSAIENVAITLQGRLTNFGVPLPDGSYTVHVDVYDANGNPTTIADVQITTVDGLFTTLLENIPTEVFECDLTDASCLQFVVATMDGYAAFPNVTLSNTGRSAVTTRVNGDFQSKPGIIEVPSYTEFVDRKAVITNESLFLFDNNGVPVFECDAGIRPDHQDPTLTVNGGLCELNCLCQINDNFAVDLNDDGTDDFVANEANGIKVATQPFSVDPTGSGDAAFSVDGAGNTTIEGLHDGFPDFTVTSAGVINCNASEFSMDRDHNATPDFWVQSNGNVSINSDLVGGNDATFGSTNFLLKKPCRYDCDADGTPEVWIGEPTRECHFDMDQDNSSELAIDANTVTVTAGFVVDNNGAAFGDNLGIGPSGFQYRAVGTLSDASVKINSSEVSWDVNQNGTKELKVQDDGGGATTTTVTSNLKVNNFGSGPDQLSVINGNTIFSSTTVNIDADGDGISSTSFGQDYSEVGGSFHVDANHDGAVDFSITSTGGVTTVTIHGNLDVDGGTKNFVQQHPEDPAKEIVYTALEAGESGTYTRGSSKLENGVVIVDLPEHFSLVTNSEGLTAQITPRGRVHSMLYVELVTTRQLVVRASDSADSQVPFDYMVNGIRSGFENHEVTRERRVFSQAH